LYKLSHIYTCCRCKVIVILFVISLTRGEDYYEILNVSRSADQNEIRKAFKKLAIIHHPDKNSVCELECNMLLATLLYC